MFRRQVAYFLNIVSKVIMETREGWAVFVLVCQQPKGCGIFSCQFRQEAAIYHGPPNPEICIIIFLVNKLYCIIFQANYLECVWDIQISSFAPSFASDFDLLENIAGPNVSGSKDLDLYFDTFIVQELSR